ncbi:MAG: anti-sigma factor [Opitutaceae bacterium]|nr:anti-sigma factor [Opitutaceae bacterium]
MSDETREELAALYAIDQLHDEERVEFEKQLSKDPELAALVRDLREASAALALSAKVNEGPSPELRDRIFISAAGYRPKKLKPAKIVAFSLHARIAWAIAACAVVAAGLFHTRYLSVQTVVSTSEASYTAAIAEIKSLEQQMEAERILGNQQLADMRKAADVANLKIARLAELTGNSPAAVAVAVWNPLNQEGVLSVESLPLLQKDQDYQLWVIDPQYVNPVNGGVFTVGNDGKANIRFQPDQAVGGATMFAISRERKGGVPKAEGPIVAAGGLQ